MASKCKIYESTVPALVIPDHFFCNQSSKLVVIYDDPIGEEDDVMTLMFPGDVSGSSPKRVVAERVGTRTLVFDTPVYSSCRGVVEVLPLLNLQNGNVAQLAHFKLTLKHPIRNVMELCLKLSTNNAILPVLLSLMVHCQGDNYKEHFQDPHIDRVMATLVGSRTPGDSTCIQDIILPSRKWRRMNLAELARLFNLAEMEKQAYILNKQRSKWASKTKNSPKRCKTILHSQTTDVEDVDLDDEDEEGDGKLCPHLSSSTPDIHTIRTIDKQEGRDSGLSDDSDIVQKFVRGAKFVCRVVEDFTPTHNQPSCIPLRVNQEVHIVQESNSDWWYGVCEDRCGYFPPSHVQSVRVPNKMRSTTISETSQRLIHPRPNLSASFREEISSHRLNIKNLSPPHERTISESERSDISQPESPRQDHLRTNPRRLVMGSREKRREDGSGAHSDSGLPTIEEPIPSKIQKPPMPSTKQQLLQKVTPILPPGSYKSYRSPSSHLPTSPSHTDSVENSDSDSYEDVMSCEEEDTAVKSQWTFGAKVTTSTTAAAEQKEAKKPYILPFMRDKILPEVPDQLSSSQKQGTRLLSDSNYDDVIVPSSDYVNIALEAFEIVDDHIYDRADEVLKSRSSIYKITASNAHVKAVTQMALAQTQKQGAQGDHQRTGKDPTNQKFGRLRQHSVKDTDDQPVAMSPRTAAFVPPRNVPRSYLYPVHHLNTSPPMDSMDTQAQVGWKGPLSPPHSGSPTMVSKVQESPISSSKTFAFPTMSPKDSEKFGTPTLPLCTAPVPPPRTSNPGASPKKAPILPPKAASEVPAVPPKTISEAPIPIAKTAHEAPFPRPKTTPEAPIPPTRTVSEAPILPPKSVPEAPILPQKTPNSIFEAPIPSLKPEAPVPPRRASEPESETLNPTPPPRVLPPSQSNLPAVHPKPLKRPVGAATLVPIPPPKPSKQEPPPPPPKTGNSQFNKLNGSGDHGKRGLGGHNTFPQPGMRMLPVNEIAQRAAALQQSSGLTVSKKYYKPS